MSARDDRAALDAIAEVLGGRAGDHRDNVVMLARGSVNDPCVHNARRARALAVVERLLASHHGLLANSDDPGVEALGAEHEARQFLQTGGGSTSPTLDEP